MKAADHYDVVIIGGGASGLAAAAELRMSSPELGVAILEKNEEPGRKLRATGSGRCNITNTAAAGYNEIMRFFRRIGLVTRAYDNGLVYPYSESAADVVELLISRAEELGVDIITGAEVSSVRKDDAESHSSRFAVTYTSGKGHNTSPRTLAADYVILATGGKAGPTYGTTGDGYRFARELGHTVVTPVPVLTSVECEEWDSDFSPCAVSLAGTRTRGVVTLYRHGEGDPARGTELFEEPGEIQFTKYGLSGICVFNMTRHMRYDRAAGGSIGDFVIKADLFPDGDITDYLRDRRENAFDGEKAADILRTVLKDNIAAYVLRTARTAARRDLSGVDACDLTDRDIAAIAGSVHCLAFHPTGLRGWKEAQATSGGVSLSEIDEYTCESLLVPGLYITGELADRDFPCGGFNLSNAWITGLHAAAAIAAGADA